LPHQEQIHAKKFGVSKKQIKRGMRLGYTLRYRNYIIDKLGVMAQKAEKTHLKIINEWLCNEQIFQKSESSKY